MNYIPADSEQMRATRRVAAARKRRLLERAAPELLAAAIALNQALYEQQNYSPSDKVVSTNLALRDAIAKAEGR
jgi:hypothetical protein